MPLLTRLSLVVLLSFSLCLSAQAARIKVEGLFNDSAVLLIDGQRHLLKVGKAPKQGVELLAANAQRARLRVDGKIIELGLSKSINGNFTPAKLKQVRISAYNGAYTTHGSINGHPVQLLVDTGANAVAISETRARVLGIKYKKGIRVFITTASGQATGYRVLLNSVAVGAIRLSNVEALVVEGSHPKEVLLGMSFLSQVKMREEAGVMVLERH